MSQITRTSLGTGCAPIEFIDIDGTPVAPDGGGIIYFTTPTNTIYLGSAANTITFDMTEPNRAGFGLDSFGAGPPYVDYTTTIGDVEVLEGGTVFVGSAPEDFISNQTVSGITSGNAYWIYVDSAGTVQKADISTTAFSATAGAVLYAVYRDATPGANEQYCTQLWQDPISNVSNTQATSNYLAFRIIDVDGSGHITATGGNQVTISDGMLLQTPFYLLTIADPAGAARTFNIMYYIGSDLATAASSTTFSTVYNNFGVGPTALTAGYYGVYSLFVTVPDSNNANPQYFAVMDRAEYATEQEALFAISRYNVDQAGPLGRIGIARLGFIVVSQATTNISRVIVDEKTTDSFPVGTTTRDAIMLPTDTTNFDGRLSSSDTTVQSALDTLDDYPTIVSGFSSWDGAGPYFDDTTLGDFTVSQSGTGYINGELISWTAPQTISGLTAGNTYYIYIDNTGTIQKTTVYSESLFSDNIVLFECLRDSTPITNNQVTVKENHPYQFPWRSSVWAHDTIGSVISNMVGGANITLNGTQKIEISGSDKLEDHGLETDIPDSGGVAEVFEQYYTNGSGKWARYLQSDTFDGTWNNGGVATALGANKYSVYRLYVSKDNINSSTPIYIGVLGDAQYNNLTQAQTAVANNIIPTATAELARLEIAQLGYIIFEESSTSIVDVIISKETVRTSFSGVSATIASLVLTDTSNFDHILSASDTTVQSALETIDDVILRADGPTDAQASSAVFTLAGGNNIGTTAAGSTVTFNVTGTTDHAVQVGNATNSLTSLVVGTNGQVLIGATGADPAFATLTSAGGTIAFTTGVNTLNLEAGGSVATTYTTDSGNAVPAAGVLSVLTGENTNTTGSGSTLRTHLNRIIRLPNTNAAGTEGVLYLGATCNGTSCTGGSKFLHNYDNGASRGCVFVGENAGNFTYTGTVGANVGIGKTALTALTTGEKNNCIGYESGKAISSGDANCCMGNRSCLRMTTATNNTCIGDGSGYSITTSTATMNVCIGHSSGFGLTTGEKNTYVGGNTAYAGSTGKWNSGLGYNTCRYVGASGNNNLHLGYLAGNSNTTASQSSNIYLQSPGVNAENNVMRLGAQGTGSGQVDTTYMAGVYQSTVGATHEIMVVDNNHQVGTLEPTAFLAYNSSGDSNQTGAGAVATIEFDTEVYDLNGDYNNATDTFTAPVDGKYLLSFTVTMDDITTAMTNASVRLSTSNRTYYGGYCDPGATKTSDDLLEMKIVVIADMDSGDTATAQVVILFGAGDTATIRGAASPTMLTYFSGHLVI